MSLDVRKIAHLLRTEFNAEQTKVTIDKKEIRCWKIPEDMVDGSRFTNNDTEAFANGWRKFKKEKEEKVESEVSLNHIHILSHCMFMVCVCV